MRELKPYQTLEELRAALDNGGQIFNLFSQADDRVVTGDELSRAAGVFSAGVNALLFLEMAQQDLSASDRDTVPSLLSAELRGAYERQKPLSLSPSLAATKGIPGRSLIVTGLARLAEDRSRFSGFIKIPIRGGQASDFAEIPIIDQFDFYEVFDDREMRPPSTVVTTRRGEAIQHTGKIRFGGMLRKLYFKDEPDEEREKQAAKKEIELLAYFKWEEAGRPDDAALKFWLEAEVEWMEHRHAARPRVYLETVFYTRL